MDIEYLINQITDEIKEKRSNILNPYDPEVLEDVLIRELKLKKEHLFEGKLLFIIGAPGVGKSYVCGRVVEKLKSDGEKIKMIDMGDRLNVLNNKGGKDEGKLGRLVETECRSDTRILILDNFDRIFSLTKPDNIADWDVSPRNPIRSEFRDLMENLKKFLTTKIPSGRQLIITMRDEAYFNNLEIFEKRLPNETFEIRDIYVVGVPANFQSLRYLYNQIYNNYAKEVVKFIFERGLDYSPMEYLSNLERFVEKEDSLGFCLPQSSFSEIVSRNVEIGFVGRLLPRLGLLYRPGDSESRENIIGPIEVLNLIKENKRQSGLKPTTLEKFKTYVYLGSPGAFVVIMSIIFVLGLQGSLSEYVSPLWISIPLGILVTVLLSWLIGFLFDQ